MSSFSRLESTRRSQGYQFVAGLDEVGRGAWAGPLVAAAVILKPYARLPNLRDSKQLSVRQRESFSKKILTAVVAYAYGVVECDEIDTIGIARANQEAFRRALKSLKPRADYALADYFSVAQCVCPVEGIKGGDERVRVIAAASVIAKVYRDYLMTEAEARFPGYGFADHKGYGTATHRRALKKLGPSPFHRRSFAVY